ncbi:spidroin-2-like [Pseudopipra pipra]|uniref:spidroin-2-like n=1 Tax=Pseudopipra pipra TaxID=415032 RepID=UPI00313A2C06
MVCSKVEQCDTYENWDLLANLVKSFRHLLPAGTSDQKASLSYAGFSGQAAGTLVSVARPGGPGAAERGGWCRVPARRPRGRCRPGRAATRHAGSGRGLWPLGCEYGLRGPGKGGGPGGGSGVGSARRGEAGPGTSRLGSDWGRGRQWGQEPASGGVPPPALPGPECGWRASLEGAGAAGPGASAKGALPSPKMAPRPPRCCGHVMAGRGRGGAAGPAVPARETSGPEGKGGGREGPACEPVVRNGATMQLSC